MTLKKMEDRSSWQKCVQMS